MIILFKDEELGKVLYSGNKNNELHYIKDDGSKHLLSVENIEAGFYLKILRCIK